MSIEGAPESPKEWLDIAARAKTLKLETSAGSVQLSSASSIDLQPSGTAFGLRLTQRNEGMVPTVLFDTKKLREPSRFPGAKQAVDEALENYENS